MLLINAQCRDLALTYVLSKVKRRREASESFVFAFVPQDRVYRRERTFFFAAGSYSDFSFRIRIFKFRLVSFYHFGSSDSL
jgi:hypothetical protein